MSVISSPKHIGVAYSTATAASTDCVSESSSACVVVLKKEEGLLVVLSVFCVVTMDNGSSWRFLAGKGKGVSHRPRAHSFFGVAPSMPNVASRVVIAAVLLPCIQHPHCWSRAEPRHSACSSLLAINTTVRNYIKVVIFRRIQALRVHIKLTFNRKDFVHPFCIVVRIRIRFLYKFGFELIVCENEIGDSLLESRMMFIPAVKIGTLTFQDFSRFFSSLSMAT